MLLADLLSMVETRREMALVMKVRPMPPLRPELRQESRADFM